MMTEIRHTRNGIAATALASAAATVFTNPAFAQTEILTPFEAVATARERLREIITGSDGALGRMAETLAETSPTGSAWWHGEIALWSLFGLVIGYAVATYIGNKVRIRMSYLFVPEPATRFDKLSYLLIRTFMMLLNLVILLLIAGGIAMGVNGGERAAQIAHGLHIGGYGAVMALSILSRNILAPDVPSHRFFPLNDELALGLHRGFITAIAIATTIFFACLWMALLGLDHQAHFLMLVSGLAAIAFVFVVAVIMTRDGLHSLVAGGKPDSELPVWRFFLAQNAYILIALYFVVALVVAEVRVLSNQPIPFSPILVPLLLPIGGGLAYMLFLLLIDLGVRRGERKRREAAEAAEVMPDIIDESEEADPHGPGFTLTYEGRSLKDVAERAVSVVVLTTIAYFVIRIWSISPEAVGFVGQFFDAVLIAFIGFIIYDGIRVVIDRRIWEEGDSFEAAEPGDEGSAKSSSRLATLLPLARNFMLITVAVMTVMIVAAELGVNIAPLFAGAGVVGLAVGFGAQTLIADIFSGAFFLIDDAFRKGDYVETGSVRGTVEKISVRSMQLRHHMGPLHTIPFSQITHLTNYSRDWAMMKLKLRLTYDTDVEKVRKLIKNLGKELQSDPEIGDKFLQPLKSQGVYAMEDSAMIIRVKFMTPPGEQFVIRKRVYADIRALFEREGIQFAHRQVTVRLANDDGETPKLTEEEKKAVTGAVLPIVQEQEEQNSGGEGDGR